MARVKITKRFLEDLKRGQREYLYDTELSGFGVHVGKENISFFVQYRHGYGRKGKVKRLSLGKFGILTVEQARHVAKQKLAKAIQGEDIARKRQEETPIPTFNALWKLYVKARPELKGIATDANRFKKHLKPRFGDIFPTELKPFHVDRLRYSMMETLKPATVRNTLELLRRLINFGVKRQLFPALSFTIELPRVNNAKTEDLSPEALKRLWQAIDDSSNTQAANMMRLTLYTGMRRGELFRLKWEHIDLERNFIRLVNPKGGKEEKIPLNSASRRLLLSHPAIGSSPYVFPGRNGQKRVDIKNSVNKIKQQAGLPKEFRALHGLRHVYASILASSGKVDLYTLQKLLTHKSPAMTQRYAHLRDEAMKNASEVVVNLVEG